MTDMHPELHTLALCKVSETLGLDLGLVDEEIGTVFSSDEAETLKAHTR